MILDRNSGSGEPSLQLVELGKLVGGTCRCPFAYEHLSCLIADCDLAALEIQVAGHKVVEAYAEDRIELYGNGGESSRSERSSSRDAAVTATRALAVFRSSDMPSSNASRCPRATGVGSSAGSDRAAA